MCDTIDFQGKIQGIIIPRDAVASYCSRHKYTENSEPLVGPNTVLNGGRIDSPEFFFVMRGYRFSWISLYLVAQVGGALHAGTTTIATVENCRSYRSIEGANLVYYVHKWIFTRLRCRTRDSLNMIVIEAHCSGPVLKQIPHGRDGWVTVVIKTPAEAFGHTECCKTHGSQRVESGSCMSET